MAIPMFIIQSKGFWVGISKLNQPHLAPEDRVSESSSSLQISWRGTVDVTGFGDCRGRANGRVLPVNDENGNDRDDCEHHGDFGGFGSGGFDSYAVGNALGQT